MCASSCTSRVVDMDIYLLLVYYGIRWLSILAIMMS